MTQRARRSEARRKAGGHEGGFLQEEAEGAERAESGGRSWEETGGGVWSPEGGAKLNICDSCDVFRAWRSEHTNC